VNDPERVALLVLRLVGGVEAVENAGQNGRACAKRDGLARALDETRDRLAVDVFHDEQHLVSVDDHVERGHDVWMMNPGREAGLVDEHRDELPVVDEVRMDTLDGNGAREPDLTQEATEVNDGHPACGDRLVKGVAPYDPDRAAWARVRRCAHLRREYHTRFATRRAEGGSRRAPGDSGG